MKKSLTEQWICSHFPKNNIIDTNSKKLLKHRGVSSIVKTGKKKCSKNLKNTSNNNIATVTIF